LLQINPENKPKRKQQEPSPSIIKERNHLNKIIKSNRRKEPVGRSNHA